MLSLRWNVKAAYDHIPILKLTVLIEIWKLISLWLFRNSAGLLNRIYEHLEVGDN